MRTVFIFHGTEGYPQENWFPWLKKECENNGCEVIVPQFPSPPIVAANVSEWFEVLRPHRAKITEETILIGHSLGGVFTLRLLEQLEHPVRACFLVGTPIGIRPILNEDRDERFSGFVFDWETIRKQSAHFTVFHSDNDPYVSLGNGERLAESLGTDLSFVPGAGHFNTAAGYTTFPLLLERLLPFIATSSGARTEKRKSGVNG